MTLRCLTLSLLLTAALISAGRASAQQPVKRGQKYALLIGIGKYREGFRELPCCQSDLALLRDCLLKAGYPAANIVYMHEGASEELRPTKTKIEAQLALRMRLPLATDDVVVAFSGHGLQRDGNSYLCPLDAQLDGPAETLLPLDAFEALIAQSAAKNKLLVLDAWRTDFLRGAKAPRAASGAAIPRTLGLQVISSCEVGQLSVDDPKLKQGVFMHYLTQGWLGAADRESEGNGDGKISVEELFYYTHEKTKIHVANQFATLQLPALLGEAAARWDLASVSATSAEAAKPITPGNTTSVSQAPATSPNIAKLGPMVTTPAPVPQSPMARDATPVPTGATKGPAPPTTHPLLAQANTLFSKADYDKAIETYNSVIANGDLAAGVRRAARLGRGSSYLAKGGKNNILQALIDYKAAGHESISLPVRKAANLTIENTAAGSVREGEVVQISLINGEWLWVKSVNNNTGKRGYVKWEAVLPPPPPPAPAQPAQNFQNVSPSFDFFE